MKLKGQEQSRILEEGEAGMKEMKEIGLKRMKTEGDCYEDVYLDK